METFCFFIYIAKHVLIYFECFLEYFKNVFQIKHYLEHSISIIDFQILTLSDALQATTLELQEYHRVCGLGALRRDRFR